MNYQSTKEVKFYTLDKSMIANEEEVLALTSKDHSNETVKRSLGAS